MSVKIPLKSLTKDQVKTIKQYLIVNKKRKYVPCKNSFLKNLISREEDDEIIMFQIIDDDIYLPYAFSCKLFGKRQNMDIHYRMINFEFKGKLWEEQEKLIKEAEVKLMECGSILFAADTGTGKTVMSVYLSSRVHVPILIMFKLEIQIKQWVKSYIELTNAKICMVSKGKIYFSYQSVVDDIYQPPDVYVSLYTQLGHFPQHVLLDIGCLIIDETHLMCVPSAVDSLLKTKPKFIIGCSATPIRTDELHSIVFLLLGVNIFYLKNTRQLKVIKVITGEVPILQTNKLGNVDWSIAVKSLYDSPTRTNIIIDIIKKYHTNNKILIAGDRKKYIEDLSTYLNKIGISSDFLCGNKSFYTETRVLCGVNKKMGAAFDEYFSCEHFSGERLNMLILIFSLKDESALKQLVGRVLRSNNPIVIDLVDESPIHEKHWRCRKKIYNCIDSEISEIDLRQPQIDYCSKIIQSTKEMLLI